MSSLIIGFKSELKKSKDLVERAHKLYNTAANQLKPLCGGFQDIHYYVAL